MLEGLSTLDWSKLTHAYGKADDIPQLLRNLTSRDEEILDYTLGQFSMTIYHQGTIYQASAYTVPFLLELVQQEEVLKRGEILFLLSLLAQGTVYPRQHLQNDVYRQSSSPTFQRQQEQEVFWVERTQQAVQEGIPLYLKLLTHPEVTIRMNASYLLSHFRDEATQLIPQLIACIQHERDQRASACLLYSISVLIKDQYEEYPDALHLLEQSFNAAKTELIRIVAAMALVRTGSPNLPARVLDVLLATIMPSEKIEDIYATLPFAKERALPGDIIIALAKLPLSLTHSLTNPRIIDFLEMVQAQDERYLEGYWFDILKRFY